MSPTIRPTAILAAWLASSVLVAQGPPRPPAAPAADAAVQERIMRERREDPNPAPARKEGEGPFTRLIIRGVKIGRASCRERVYLCV